MRTKSEARKQAILAEAARLFQAHGYEGASMAELSARVGGSKATLYSYFRSKEELFFEVMFHLTEEETAATQAMLDPAQPDIGGVLLRYGEAFLGLKYRPDVVAATRLAIAQCGRAQIGPCYERSTLRRRQELGAYLAELMRQGRLRASDPVLAASQLIGLLKAEVDLEFLLDIRRDLEPAQAAATAARAVDGFLRIYGPSPG